MKEPSRDNRLYELRARMEAKRDVLNQEALRVYKETGKLTDPILCELADEFEDIAGEYQRMLSGDENIWLSETEKSE